MDFLTDYLEVTECIQVYIYISIYQHVARWDESVNFCDIIYTSIRHI